MRYNKPIKRTPFSHWALVKLLVFYFRVMLLCKVVLLNKIFNNYWRWFLSGIPVLGRRLSATPLADLCDCLAITAGSGWAQQSSNRYAFSTQP